MCADGAGLTRITKALNAEHVPSPRPQQGRPRAWATTSSVRSVLFRSLYRGEITWNQTRKRDGWGQQHQADRPETEWVRVPAPELRIVSEQLWATAHRQLERRHAQYAQLGGGRARRDADTPYLLSVYLFVID